MTAPSHAMVLAAGLGVRMRPLTLSRPKPLIEVAGRSMLERVLDHLDRVDVAKRVVNIHWLGEMIVRALEGRPGVVISDERGALLETGGGVAKALPHLGAGPFYVANADIVWEDGAVPALARLASSWDGAAMDALLLMQPVATAFGYRGAGDFHLDDHGRLTRRGEGETSPLLFAGVQILHPRLFDGAPAGAFSLNRLYDRAAAAGRLHGIVHDGAWYHVGTPDALAGAEDLMAKRRRG